LSYGKHFREKLQIKGYGIAEKWLSG
jgi:transposase